jgi:predicted RNase H-like HicB family nuclease
MLVMERTMLTRYMNAALAHAHYELLSEEEGYCTSIPELPGVWANGETIEATRNDLREALEGWIALPCNRMFVSPRSTALAWPFRLSSAHLRPSKQARPHPGATRLGFDGPFTGTGKHPEYMTRGMQQLKLPNPHRGDIGPKLPGKLLDQVGITREEWEVL